VTPSNDEGGTTRQVVLILDGGVEVVLWRMDGLYDHDLGVVDTLARLQLAARRVGGSIRLRNPRDELLGLLDLVGLTEVFADAVVNSAVDDLPGPGAPGGAAPLPFETGGQAERGEQLGIEEVVDRRDPPLGCLDDLE
jgi:hypothetical protein